MGYEFRHGLHRLHGFFLKEYKGASLRVIRVIRA